MIRNTIGLENKIEYGRNIKLMAETKNYRVMQIVDKTGEGYITMRKIMEGVYLTSNDMHLSQCISEFKLKEGMEFFCIDHCREGRIESAMGNGAFSYLQEHELRIDNRNYHTGPVTFPLNHFHGMSIGFDMKIATEELKRMYGGFSIDLFKLREKYCSASKPYVIKGESGIEHIFSELYQVPSQIRDEYYKVKTLELLLYLDALQISDAKEERPYYYKSQIEKVKAIQQLLTSDLQEHYTLDVLSEQFQISLTAMKNCFKQVYGDSIYSYMKRYRMNCAASLLRQNEGKTVAEIAGLMGYESPSKFATAFRQVIGCTPLEYRKAII